MIDKTKNIILETARKRFDRLNYVPNEFYDIFPNTELDRQIINILKDRPFTYLQLEKFFPQVDLLARLTDLCFKNVLDKVYNGHIYYRLKGNLRIKVRKHESKVRTKIRIEIPKGYTWQDYKREKLNLNSPVVLSFKDGKFRNPKVQE